jgi:RNA polymerase primary sigma factor
MSLKSQVVGLNKLFAKIYGTEIRLSSLLLQLGFNNQQVEIIREQHLEYVVISFITLFKERVLKRFDGERLYRIISRRFSLDGEPSETLQSLGVELGISKERVRQLEEKAIRRCKAKSNVKYLEEGLHNIVTLLIENTDSEKRKFSVVGELRDIDVNNGAVRLSNASVSKSQNVKSYSLEDIRLDYSRAYEKWSCEEDEQLRERYKQGASFTEIANTLQRNRGAIRARLKKLSILD